jgi:hypothetical protein
MRFHSPNQSMRQRIRRAGSTPWANYAALGRLALRHFLQADAAAAAAAPLSTYSLGTTGLMGVCVDLCYSADTRVSNGVFSVLVEVTNPDRLVNTKSETLHAQLTWKQTSTSHSSRLSNLSQPSAIATCSIPVATSISGCLCRFLR